jgi:recombinational DNA repair protein RecR
LEGKQLLYTEKSSIFGIKFGNTRIGHGCLWGGLDYADPGNLTQALEGRKN